MNKLILIFLFLYSCKTDKVGFDSCSNFSYSLNLNLTISDFRLIEKKLNSEETFTESKDQFGYRKRPLEQNEIGQPKFFIQKIDEHLVEKTYYYNLPDSNVYAIIYEWENVHGAMGGTYPKTLQIEKMPSKEYLKCQFQKLTDSLTISIGKYKESENFGTVREWHLNGKTVHLNLTLENKTNRRLRLVVFKE